MLFKKANELSDLTRAEIFIMVYYKRKHVIDLTNSPLLKTSLELSPVSYSISYPIPPKGPL